jgi:CHAD domain-containing protein
VPRTKGPLQLSAAKSLFNKLTRTGRKLSSEAKPEDVHQLRTTCRRLETLLTAHEDQLGGAADKLVKQLAHLRRKAGHVRDFDVQMNALRAIHVECITRDKARLMRDLDRERQKHARKLVSVVEQEFGGTMRKRSQKALEQLSTIPAATPPPDHAGLALERLAAVANEYVVLDEDNLHAFRIALKRVRYLAELGATGNAATVVAECKRAQDAIGEWHDLVMLAERAQRLFPKGQSPLAAVLRTARSAKLTEAFRASADVKQNLLQLRAAPRPAPGPELVSPSRMTAVAG